MSGGRSRQPADEQGEEIFPADQSWSKSRRRLELAVQNDADSDGSAKLLSPVSRFSSRISAASTKASLPDPSEYLTGEQLVRIRDVFSTCSIDSEGDLINTSDVGLVMRAAGLCPTEAQVRSAELELDPEGVESVGYGAFLEMIAPKMNDDGLTEVVEDVKNDLLLCFRSLCSEIEQRQAIKGLISEKDLRTAMLSYGEMLSQDELSQMIREADVDKETGYINYIDFTERVLGEHFD